MESKEHKIYELFIGRYQVPQPHEGHIKLIRKILNEGKNVCIALRKEDGTEQNPYSQKERREGFETIFINEIKEGKIVIIDIPDIANVCYGRKVGWGIREIKLSKEIENISGTEIRKNEIKKN